MGYKTATSSGRSVQSLQIRCIHREVLSLLIPSDLLFIYLLQRYSCAKQLHIFLRFNDFLHTLWFAKNIGVKGLGKSALILHSAISVTEKVKINEQNKSIATGIPLSTRQI